MVVGEVVVGEVVVGEVVLLEGVVVESGELMLIGDLGVEISLG